MALSLHESASKLIEMHFDGKLSREGLIEGMLVMDKQFPHIGWKEQASSLVAYYRGEEDVDIHNPTHYQESDLPDF